MCQVEAAASVLVAFWFWEALGPQRASEKRRQLGKAEQDAEQGQTVPPAPSPGGVAAPAAFPSPSPDARLLPLLAGEIFLETAPDKFTLEEAEERCRARGAALASPGQLYAAWSAGLDACSPGWLADGSVRYPIVTPRERCGGALPGVKTIFLFRNQTGFPDAHSRYDAYCFRGNRGTPGAHAGQGLGQGCGVQPRTGVPPCALRAAGS